MKKIFFLLSIITLLTSCVTKQRFTELADRYDDLYESNDDLIVRNDKLIKNEVDLHKKVKDLEAQKEYLENQSKILNEEVDAALTKYDKLQKSYAALASNSSSAINSTAKENQKLLNELDDKETRLFEKEANLAKLTAALNARSNRIQDLETLIASKEAAMQQLKSAISNALKGFEGKGLTVEQRDGKVYVSMDNKLLFNSGQWAVGANGKTAVVELAGVLVQNPTINVLIEGHTDNDQYKSGGVIQDNWDLSVKRATAIVRILQDNKVSPKQITAAGHGEYIPVASNKTIDGKAKNRRIEVVLSPKFDEVTKLLNE